MDRVKSQTSSNAAVFGEEWKRFIKMFPTAGAMISTLGIVKESFFTHERDILNNGSTIIMDLFGHRTTAVSYTHLDVYKRQDYGRSVIEP